MDSPAPAVPLCIASVACCAETGAFRFFFAPPRAEVSADLTVCWLEDKGLAYLRFAVVDAVHGADGATERAVEAWVEANQELVFERALEAA